MEDRFFFLFIYIHTKIALFDIWFFQYFSYFYFNFTSRVSFQYLKYLALSFSVDKDISLSDQGVHII